jgi:ligand-binding sensor protein
MDVLLNFGPNWQRNDEEMIEKFQSKSWWSKTRWRASSSPTKKMKENCFNGVESQQHVICVTL